ncbi:MAG: hypothetical protein ACKVU2_08125 [Saprospiraceae bacterium]
MLDTHINNRLHAEPVQPRVHLNTRDMGRDGNSANTGDLARNRLTGRDVAAFKLGYYYGDYRLRPSGETIFGNRSGPGSRASQWK